MRELILEDASKLKERQETDTIDIIDDLRYAINDTITYSQVNNPLGFTSSFQILIEKEKRLNLIDNILKELNLEC